MSRRTLILGPAYLDRVLRVDRPLIDPRHGPPLDQSVDGVWTFAEGLRVIDPDGRSILIAPPGGWPGPTGIIALSRPLGSSGDLWHREALGVSWQDDLGGMGAGFASALGARLISALGPEDDPTSRQVSARLRAAGVEHLPIRVDAPADWTLLLTSGPFGDKLPIGFRGCHAAIPSLRGAATAPCDLRVVASLPNALAAEALAAPGAAIRAFAPAMRNMIDRQVPVHRFADAIDVLCCNQREWEELADREQVAWKVSLLVITEGASGSSLRFTTPEGEPGFLRIDAFPRQAPPRDTNRAGEAFASTLLMTLLDAGWTPGVTPIDLARHAAVRASAAAALVLDRLDFGFPDRHEIDHALDLGFIEDRPRDADVPSR